MIELTFDQLCAVREALEKERLLLVAGLGFGKTIVALTFCRILLRDNPSLSIAIVSLKSHLELTWKSELLIPNFLPKWMISRISLVSIDFLAQNKPKRPFDVVILDECTLIKNTATRRYKAMKQLCQTASFVLFLTATPITKSLLDIWAIISALVKGTHPLEETFSRFKEKYFSQFVQHTNVRPLVTYIPFPTSAKEVSEKIQFCVARGGEYELSTKLTTDVIYIPPTAAFAKTYNNLVSKARLAVHDLRPADAAIRFSRAHQYVSGGCYEQVLPPLLPDPSPYFFNTLKIDQIVNYTKGLKDSFAVVYFYRFQLDQLNHYFPEGKTLDKNSLIEWNGKKLRVLFLHATADSHSFNLQKGGATLLWFYIPCSPTDYMQMIGRFHRRGQTTPVKNLIFLVKGTVDEKIYVRILTEGRYSKDFNELLTEIPSKVIDN